MSPTPPKPVVLVILDGWGLRAETAGNAVALARTPTFDRLWAEAPRATLKAHGEAVGLPEGQMGNSEVGHVTIGAGRVVWMDLPRIDRAIEDGSFAENPALRDFIAKVKDAGGRAHLAGLLGPGGVHAHTRHMVAAARAVAAAGVPVRLHLFLDGRDTPPKAAPEHLAALREALEGADGEIRIASVVGRFYAMDRDNRWDRTGAAAALLLRAEGDEADTPEDAVAAAHGRGETDEFVSPAALPGHDGMRDGDGLLFLNFRADRARQILSALADPKFDAVDTGPRPDFAAVTGLVEYSSEHNRFMDAMFPPEEIVNTLGHWVAAHGRRQMRLAETEKYPHVTFFLNGGEETASQGEDRHMAPSPKVRTYDLQPEMAEPEVAHRLVETIRGGKHDLIVVNFANPDMVGHTGDLAAAIRACEAVDEGLGRALAALQAAGGAMIVTADHGNAEQMIDPETGGPHTAHTLNPVPVALVGGPPGVRLREGGGLADLAPTLLELMALPQPPEMTGRSLLIRANDSE